MNTAPLTYETINSNTIINGDCIHTHTPGIGQETHQISQKHYAVVPAEQAFGNY